MDFRDERSAGAPPVHSASPARHVDAELVDSSYYYAPSSDMGPYLSSSLHQRLTPKTKRASCVKRTLPFVAVIVLIVVITVVVVTVRAGSSSDDDASTSSDASGNGSGSSASTATAADSVSSSPALSSSSSSTGDCPTVAANDRTVVFWQSEVAGCDLLPKGVTHVIWGFALVADGSIVPTFQGADSTLIDCVQQLRAKCILSLGGIGGSTNNDNMTAVVDAATFAKSAVALVKKFDFDGLDLDDETVGSQFNSTRVVDLLQATRTELNAVNTSLLLTYDAYFYEGQPSFCQDPDNTAYSRCFPTGVLAYVDWINIMAYNVNQANVTAEAVYAAAITSTFAAWSEQLANDFSRATIGVCVADNCAYGPGPNATIIADWNDFARQDGYGGMMVYAASGEVADDFPVTRSLIVAS